MKILAVRGKNLASLAGHFEVDFTKPPLDHAGLIAITGPTGAGKTTLLDAMCLALFDRTPRFANRGGVVIGGLGDDSGGGLRASDVRGILRHGAVEGWAEVDFLGIDERRWRARWEVRRARGRAEGRIQAQQMTLIDPLDERVVAADRKGDTLAAIEARLGLDFDQFRRSVLLAQGEFAAFLEASGGERAELLERMTGTWLYRELGRGAFERAKQAERELELVRRERGRLEVRDAAGREQLEAEVEAKRARQRELEVAHAEAEAALRWYRRAEELEAALVQAREHLAELADAQSELEGREQLLAQVERVAALRERLATRDRWTRDLDGRERDLEFVRGELPLIETQLAELRTRLEDREQCLERARERRRRLAGDLDRARELDTKIAGAAAERERLAAKLAQAERGRAAAESSLSQLEVSLDDARARLRENEAWLAAHAGLTPLAEHWPHYRSLLSQHLRQLEARGALDRGLAELRPRLARSEAQLAEAKRERDKARNRRSQAQKRLRKVERELDRLPPLAALRHRQAALDRCRDRLARLERLRERHAQLATSARELEGEHAEQVVERDHRARERRRVEAELAQAEQTFAEAQRGLRQLEAVRDLVEHRAELRAGEPCPVCGGTEHPAAEELAPVDAVVTRERERVEALLRRRDELGREQGEHLGREQLAGQRILAVDRRLRELERERGGLQDEWREALAEGPLLLRDEGEAGDEDEESEDAREVENSPNPEHADLQLSLLGGAGDAAEPELPERLDSPELDPAMWSVAELLDRRARHLAGQRDEVEDLLDKQRVRRARRDEEDQTFEESRARLAACERERDLVAREIEEARTRAEDLDEDLDARHSELADVVPAALAAIEAGAAPAGEDGLRRRLEEVGAELLTRLDDAAQRFAARRTACEQAVEGLRTLDTRRAELGSVRQARAEACAALEIELREHDETLAGLRRERGARLGGRPVAEVSRELEAAIELAGRDREATKDALAKVERELHTQRTRVHTLAEQVATLRTSSEEAQRSVDQALAEVGVDRATLDELLGREQLWAEGWIGRTRKAVDEARSELERRRAVVGERERVRAEHHREGPPELEQELASRRREELELEAKALRRELFELEHRLRRDSEERAAARELEPRLHACEQAAKIWGRLRDAIGSATGDKFQKFAQSLTLELLLTQANAQLRELKPRYALSRVPKHDLELQLVDHDLGDEVRSIRGLSGGEKFLVSLALALALASLSAEDCRIDSLFIDEGFGSLDAHSLDVAVSTLDTLQAEGRQIGVISHVPGLAERVGVEIRVEPVSSGRSRVRVVGPASAPRPARERA
jgi:exonuclease SbcC